MERHLEEAHVGERLVVAEQLAAHGRHPVAPEEAELRFGVGGAEFAHEVRGVEVAAGFAGNQKVFHGQIIVGP